MIIITAFLNKFGMCAKKILQIEFRTLLTGLDRVTSLKTAVKLRFKFRFNRGLDHVNQTVSVRFQTAVEPV